MQGFVNCLHSSWNIAGERDHSVVMTCPSGQRVRSTFSLPGMCLALITMFLRSAHNHSVLVSNPRNLEIVPPCLFTYATIVELYVAISTVLFTRFDSQCSKARRTANNSRLFMCISACFGVHFPDIVFISMCAPRPRIDASENTWYWGLGGWVGEPRRRFASLTHQFR